jgi:hypothetical protein
MVAWLGAGDVQPPAPAAAPSRAATCARPVRCPCSATPRRPRFRARQANKVRRPGPDHARFPATAAAARRLPVQPLSGTWRCARGPRTGPITESNVDRDSNSTGSTLSWLVFGQSSRRLLDVQIACFCAAAGVWVVDQELAAGGWYGGRCCLLAPCLVTAPAGGPGTRAGAPAGVGSGRGVGDRGAEDVGVAEGGGAVLLRGGFGY